MHILLNIFISTTIFIYGVVLFFLYRYIDGQSLTGFGLWHGQMPVEDKKEKVHIQTDDQIVIALLDSYRKCSNTASEYMEIDMPALCNVLGIELKFINNEGEGFTQNPRDIGRYLHNKSKGKCVIQISCDDDKPFPLSRQKKFLIAYYIGLYCLYPNTTDDMYVVNEYGENSSGDKIREERCRKFAINILVPVVDIPRNSIMRKRMPEYIADIFNVDSEMVNDKMYHHPWKVDYINELRLTLAKDRLSRE